jgi:hypothetical protein
VVTGLARAIASSKFAKTSIGAKVGARKEREKDGEARKGGQGATGLEGDCDADAE